MQDSKIRRGRVPRRAAPCLTAVAVVLAMLSSTSAVAAADPPAGSAQDEPDAEQRLDELERTIENLKNANEEKVRRLKERIAALEAQLAGQSADETDDALAAIRAELYDPDTLEPMEFREGLRERGVSPCLTWWQSEFVRLRLQYQHVRRDFLAAWGAADDDKVWLQVTFAFVITSSVAIAGMLVVFSLLVIPAVIATLFVRGIAARLAVSWGVGIAACLVGMVGPYKLDLPSGPAPVRRRDW